MGIKAEKANLFVKVKSEEDTTYKEFGCFTGQTGLMSRGERPLSDKSCKKIGNENGKKLKAKEFSTATIDYDLVMGGTAGEKVINDAYDDGVTELTIRLELDNTPDDGTHGTYIDRDVLVSKIESSDDADEWTQTATFELLGEYSELAAE